jgi:sulfate/thiosulfate transport system substrate-binding protein
MSALRTRTGVAALSLTLLAGAACSKGTVGSGSGPRAAGPCKPADTPVVSFAAYSTPREVYGKIIPAFQAKWKEDHNQSVIFQESYGGSTTQAQNVVNGYPADVVALSLAPDVDTIKAAGLITHDWTTVADDGMVSASLVVFDVRPGNPKNIHDWNDLTQPGLQILTPDPAQSGGARWNIVAAYGAAERGKAASVTAGDAGAQTLLEGIFKNATVLDKSARDSIKNFESGNGDVAITYENEVFTAQKAGLPDEMVIPPSTVLIENPVAVVDKNAEQHCVTDVANAFVDFLHSADARALYTSPGFLRPTDPTAAAAGDGDKFAPVTDLFTVKDLGGWTDLGTKVFGDTGIFTNAFKAAQG